MKELRQFLNGFVSVVWLVFCMAQMKAAAAEPEIRVGALPDGAQSLPTKQILQTPGKSLHFRGRAVDLVIAPNGRTVYVKNLNNLVVLDGSNWSVEQSTNYPGNPASMHGMAVSRDGSRVFVTAAGNELYEFAAETGGKVSLARRMRLSTNSDPCGIALSADGSNAFLCLGRSNSLAVVDLASGAIARQINVGVAPWGVVLSKDETTAYVSDWGGRRPMAGDLTGSSIGTRIVVDDRGIAASGAVSIIDLRQNVEVAEVPAGLHASDLTLSRDGNTLYVANANSDTVTVINTRTKTVQETILMRPEAALPFGSASDALCLSRDESTLFVANGGNNAVAVVELPNQRHTDSIVRGYIPTDWYPGALRADSYNLYVANVKGIGSEHGEIYQFTGSVDKIPLPDAATLSKYTSQVRKDGRVPEMLRSQAPALPGRVPVPVPEHVGEPSVFAHVLYVIKENKTYDQVFGDIPQGNGSAKLCIYPKLTTPNQHALATQYVLLDNYYCNGVFSNDGHSWCTEANATDYWEKTLASFDRSGQIGNDPLIYSSSGFIWNNVIQHGLTFHNYGVLGSSFTQPPDSTWLQIYADYTTQAARIKFATYTGNPPVLPRYSSTNVSGFNLKIPDQIRADGFLKEFSAAVSSNSWPAFNMFYLPDDHTAGGSPGYPTPRAQVADNDLALGRVVEAVTKSCFASNTVIFVIEDDPQSGFDHVDGHRSICMVISPYTKRGQTVSTFYNQIGLIHTMEQILGLPPMNQMDSMGPLMTDCFMMRPDSTPYTALSNNIPLDEMNPGTASIPSRKDRYWAEQSLKMDFSQPDLVNDDTLNRIIWHSIKGDSHYPAEFAGPHGKGLKLLGLIAARPGKTDDDD